ncbi:MATE family efflux transporter [Kitasatospora sp. NPDC015120]|uniref:MATE family efflux transporter n=1 Tax=Kitasatospora sp. NPDC015120 TaxID=3364023 RepID=UPI0036F45E38
MTGTTAVAAPTVRRIAGFAAPVVLSEAVALGAQFAVVAMLGAAGGHALYLRSLYTPVGFLLVALNSALSVALQVVAARAAGAGRRSELPGRLAAAARLGACCYLVCGVLVTAGAGPLGVLLDVPAADRTPFLAFLTAMVAVNAVGALGELCAAVLRGSGATGRGLLLTLTSAGLLLAGVGGFGLGAGWGLTALPVAALGSGVVEVLLGALLLRRAGLLGRPTARPTADGTGEVRAAVVSVGLPVGASFLLLCVVNLALLRVVAPFGPGAVAGFTLGSTLQSAVIVPAVGFGSAVAILVNQAGAAGDRAAARRAVRTGGLLTAGCYLAVTAVLWTAGAPLAARLSADPATAGQAVRFLQLAGPSFGCTALALTALTLLEQTGHGLVAFALNVVYFGAVIAVGGPLSAARHSTDALYLTMTAGACLGVAVCWTVLWWLLHRPLGAARGDSPPGGGRSGVRPPPGRGAPGAPGR